MSKCYGCNKRILSNAVANGLNGGNCVDVCVNPQCGDPEFLTVLTPVVYDEIGINICRTIPFGDIIDGFPTTAFANVEVIDISYETSGENAVTVSQITSRPNCYEVTLTNLSVTFAIKLYDCCKRLLTTETLSDVLYLPPDTTNPGYDSDTNPTSVSLELFAPYGVVYEDGNVENPTINFIGFSTTNSTLTQGLNMTAIPKVLDFDIGDSTITVGLTLVVSSVYFVQYQLPHNGKAIVSKGQLTTSEESACMSFVSGSLLDRNIKPLEFCNPSDNKEPCDTCDDESDCASLTPSD